MKYMVRVLQHDVQHCTALPPSKDPKPTETAEHVTTNIHLASNMQYLFNEWRRLHNEQLYALYTSSNIIRVIKPRRVRSPGHVACMGDRRGAYRFWWRDLRETDNLTDLRVDRRTILKWIFKKVGWGSMKWIAQAQDRDRVR
jgi:hypothetical protein